MQTEKRFLDESGRLTQWPTKNRDKLLVLSYLSSKFKLGESYNEQEINDVLKQWHTFNDWPLLRRELYERGFMTRTLDGSSYELTQIDTSLDDLKLVLPNIERDAEQSVEWLDGEEGRETLRLMGNNDDDNKPSTLEKEQSRIRDFICSLEQRTWTLAYQGKPVGAIWLDLTSHKYLKSPSIHMMIGASGVRGKGIGSSATQAVIGLLKGEGQFAKLYSRHLVSNQVPAKLMENMGFSNDGDPYDDEDGLRWQNVSLALR